jgi:hypothetical protein
MPGLINPGHDDERWDSPDPSSWLNAIIHTLWLTPDVSLALFAHRCGE